MTWPLRLAEQARLEAQLAVEDGKPRNEHKKFPGSFAELVYLTGYDRATVAMAKRLANEAQS